MEGLHGYPGFDKAGTFSRLKLTRMLELVGISGCAFHVSVSRLQTSESRVDRWSSGTL